MGFASTSWRWELAPFPLEGVPDRIVCWVQSITGMRLDSGGVARGLNPEEWAANRTRLAQLGGPPTSSFQARLKPG